MDARHVVSAAWSRGCQTAVHAGTRGYDLNQCGMISEYVQGCRFFDTLAAVIAKRVHPTSRARSLDSSLPVFFEVTGITVSSGFTTSGRRGQTSLSKSEVEHCVSPTCSGRLSTICIRTLVWQQATTLLARKQVETRKLGYHLLHRASFVPETPRFGPVIVALTV